MRPTNRRLPDAVALLMTVVLTGCPAAPRDTSKNTGEHSPAAAPANNQPESSTRSEDEVSVALIDGSGLAEVIEKYRGRVVLVDFWATWCSSCVEQLPHTIDLHRLLAERGLSVVTVSLNEPEEEDAVLEFLKGRGATLANYISRHGGSDKSMEDFDLDGGLPHYKLYDRQGKLHRTFATGAENLDTGEIDRAIETLLGP